ncbi:unnamed protein product, partial [Linum tenue]
ASSWFTPIPEFEKARGNHKSGDQPTSSFNNEQCSIQHGVPTKSLLLTDSNSKVRRAARPVRQKLQGLVSKQQCSNSSLTQRLWVDECGWMSSAQVSATAGEGTTNRRMD